jgi:hypothetical protein
MSGGTNQHQRRNEPQRHRHHQRNQRQDASTPSERSTLPMKEAPWLLLQRAESAARPTSLHQRGRHEARPRSAGTPTTMSGRGGDATTTSGASMRRLTSPENSLPDPAAQKLDSSGQASSAPTASRPRRPPRRSSRAPHASTCHQCQREQRQHDHARQHAVGDRAPEGVEEQAHEAARITPAASRSGAAAPQPRPTIRFRPSHCCAQKPRP